MAPCLRKIYEVLGCFSTATHTEMCKDLRRPLEATGPHNLASYFADALESNNAFNQIVVPFIPDTRVNDEGTNPVTIAMQQNGCSHNITISPERTYKFTYVEREVPHLRAANLNEQENKAWIDYVARTGNRPILGEIKWQGDKNPFYAFIQLLTYLSEMATPNQIKRAIKHDLFGERITAITAFDLHIVLANFNDRGEKGALIERTRELADVFKRRLNDDHPEAARCLGDVLCLCGTVNVETNTFSNLGCHWIV
jgi:hypothetical protein